MSLAIEQGTDEWRSIRLGRLTGTRVPAILGMSPYMSRDDVMREMVREYFGADPEFTGNVATRHGQATEPRAIARYEQETRRIVTKVGFMVHEEHSWIGVSPDGLIDLEGAVEVKCPFHAKVPYSVRADNKRMYLGQCLLQMAVLKVEWLDFICYLNDDVFSIERLHASEEKPDEWLKFHLPRLQEFYEAYKKIISKKSLATQYLNEKKNTTKAVVVTDPLLDRIGVLAQMLRQHERHIEPIKKELDELKRRAFEQNGNCQNDLVSVTCIERRGQIDYKKFMDECVDHSLLTELLGERSMDDFRKKSTFVYECKLIQET